MKDTKIVNGKLERNGKIWDYTEAALTADFNRKKPVIDEAKVLNAEEKGVVEHTLKMEGRMLIHSELKPIKNDYKHDFDRGSVEHNPKCKNYSFHKIVIPDGTVIRDSNFTQKDPHTQAIEGKNLHFISCNLVNVELDPSWVVEDCNTCQIQSVITKQTDKVDGTTELEVSHQVEKDGNFTEVDKYTVKHKTNEAEYSMKRFIVSPNVVKISEVA